MLDFTTDTITPEEAKEIDMRLQLREVYGFTDDEIDGYTIRDGRTVAEFYEVCEDATRRGEDPKAVLPAPIPAEAPAMNIISAQDLQEKEIPPTEYLVEDILPEGTSILSGASKVGKSWGSVKLGICIASGQPFMGKKTKKCGVLYLALEDGLGRLQSRLNKVLDGKKAPAGFFLYNRAKALDTGFLGELDSTLRQNPNIKLVIIDTFQKIRGQALPRETAYAYDYRETSMVKEFMDDRGLSVLLIHHNRKMRDESDPHNMISGTNGIMGACDTIWTITKDKRDSEEASLHITGRDVEQMDIIIRFNKDTCCWENVGDATAVSEQRLREKYDADPIVKTVKHLLETSEGHTWKGSSTKLMKLGQDYLGSPIAQTAQQLGIKLREVSDLLNIYDGIAHDVLGNGTGGKTHVFYSQG